MNNFVLSFYVTLSQKVLQTSILAQEIGLGRIFSNFSPSQTTGINSVETATDHHHFLLRLPFFNLSWLECPKEQPLGGTISSLECLRPILFLTRAFNHPKIW